MLQPEQVYVQPIPISAVNPSITLEVLRLDKIHPTVSGNKWFKLELHIQNAFAKKCHTIATFGGCYSNHIIATAFACKQFGFSSIGFIRGDVGTPLSTTLQEAASLGMTLNFIDRQQYRDKEAIQQQFDTTGWYWINEGGYSVEGAMGIQQIFEWISNDCTHIVCAVGSGTTMAGCIKAASAHQTVIGISPFKNNTGLVHNVTTLLTAAESKKSFQMIDEYHFGGFGKYTTTLIDWMNTIWLKYQLDTDLVYTSKMMWALFELLPKQFFPPKSKIVAIHSGGLQGNLSLPKGMLLF